MATQFGRLAIRLEDDDQERTGQVIYINIDDTATLAAIITNAQTALGDLDNITDSAVRGFEIAVRLPFAGLGLKASPTAGAENERTGLINWEVLTSPYSFGQDIAAFLNAAFIGNKIDFANGNVSAWTTLMTTGVGPLTFVAPEQEKVFTVVNSGFKTFRKHRRALRRS